MLLHLFQKDNQVNTAAYTDLLRRPGLTLYMMETRMYFSRSVKRVHKAVGIQVLMVADHIKPTYVAT